MDYVLFSDTHLNNYYNQVIDEICSDKICNLMSIDKYYFNEQNQSYIITRKLIYNKHPFAISINFLPMNVSKDTTEESICSFISYVKKKKLDIIDKFRIGMESLEYVKHNPSNIVESNSCRETFFYLFWNVKVIDILTEMVDERVNIYCERLNTLQPIDEEDIVHINTDVLSEQISNLNLK